ncbi:hypothetical protein DFS34DRAFT_687122 [Phlyctochytrium arcticum]|nr:hypothetical protein DFS34DRAFT_687122 [Phlyctochytrium arcticum]
MPPKKKKKGSGKKKGKRSKGGRKGKKLSSEQASTVLTFIMVEARKQSILFYRTLYIEQKDDTKRLKARLRRVEAERYGNMRDLLDTTESMVGKLKKMTGQKAAYDRTRPFDPDLDKRLLQQRVDIEVLFDNMTAQSNRLTELTTTYTRLLTTTTADLEAEKAELATDREKQLARHEFEIADLHRKHEQNSTGSRRRADKIVIGVESIASQHELDQMSLSEIRIFQRNRKLVKLVTAAREETRKLQAIVQKLEEKNVALSKELSVAVDWDLGIGLLADLDLDSASDSDSSDDSCSDSTEDDAEDGDSGDEVDDDYEAGENPAPRSNRIQSIIDSVVTQSHLSSPSMLASSRLGSPSRPTSSHIPSNSATTPSKRSHPPSASNLPRRMPSRPSTASSTGPSHDTPHSYLSTAPPSRSWSANSAAKARNASNTETIRASPQNVSRRIVSEGAGHKSTCSTPSRSRTGAPSARIASSYASLTRLFPGSRTGPPKRNSAGGLKPLPPLTKPPSSSAYTTSAGGLAAAIAQHPRNAPPPAACKPTHPTIITSASSLTIMDLLHRANIRAAQQLKASGLGVEGSQIDMQHPESGHAGGLMYQGGLVAQLR